MDSGVVCSTELGNSRASERGMDNRTIPRFFMPELVLSRIKFKLTDMITSDDVKTPKVGSAPSCIGAKSIALPEKTSSSSRNSDKGVSTQYAHSKTSPHWYALRATYGREKKAYEYIVKHNGVAFYPTIFVDKIVKGKRKSVEISRVPNIFFAYGTEEEIQSYVYDNINLPYLRFYYNYHREGTKITKEPLVVPDNQIESLKIICSSKAEDIIVIPENVRKFKEGQHVRVINGTFTGVEGHVARYMGQQRVAVIINDLLTVATAYIPSAFLKEIK